MKKIVLAILSFCCLALVSCTNNGDPRIYSNSTVYNSKSIETINDSNGRPHRIVVFRLYDRSLCVIDLDANTYK